ncbi:nucleotide exchange factor GrpE [Methanoculleus sp.]|uniref:nucleotide exchange factor GrpE n=1 Tax=Methanoculleus sp. TaxID=90427 RepID=UPI002607EC67|nr:nucleotide exchange factor GrpE [Methanoculleus sp.]MDI6866149.1 nucleotide exchange factor GrpE [Methanoculleus sp.]
MKENTSEPSGEQQTLAEEADAASPALEELQKSYDELKLAYDDLNDRYLRLAADFENYRKRMARELENLTRLAIEDLAVELLEVVDNFERADRAESGGLGEGMQQIQKLLMGILERHGIRPIECLNRPFDPECQDAIAYVPSEAKEGTVIEEAVRGYCMQDKVIRCAKVVVSKGKEE